MYLNNKNSMAAPITHIALTELVWKDYFLQESENKFILGTSFPDIRYLKIIEREKTHFQNCNWIDLQSQKSSFLKGMYFHSIVDKVREDFVVQNGIYQLLPEHKFITQSIKFVEDILFYSRVKDWQKYIDCFKLVDDDEMAILDNSDGISKWHSLLSAYFATAPNNLSLSIMIHGFGLPTEVVNSIIELAGEIESNSKVIDIINTLYLEFPNLLSTFIRDSSQN